MPRRSPTPTRIALVLALAAGAACQRASSPPPDIYARPSPQETAELIAQAKAGLRSAQRELGRRYYGGDGVPQDPAVAARWWQKAAEAGDDQAQAALALQLFTGDGVAQDQARARQWWERAALGGNVESQANLGWLYFNGIGVKRDPARGYAWISLAAEAGVERARVARDEFARGMEGGELAQAAQLAAQLRARIHASQAPGVREGHLQKVSEATAFFVSKDGDAVTASHVVAECAQLRLADRSGVVTVKRTDTEHDLALLHVPGRVRATAVLSRDPGAVRQGDAVVVFGYPLNAWLSNGGNLTPGTVSALTGLGNDPNQWQITAPIQPGSSGSPVFDQRGVVVGVVSMHLSDERLRESTGSSGQNLNFAVNGARLTEFLRRERVPYRSGGFFRFPRDNADIADEARTFTRAIECWK
jgi:S1-C subfamily serine protease